MLKLVEKKSGKNDALHNKYKSNYQYHKDFIEFIDKIKKAYSSFSDSINDIFNKKFICFEEKSKSNIFYSLMISLKNHIQYQSQEYKELSSLITNEVIEPYKKSKSESDKIEDKLKKEYNEVSKKLKKAKSKFEEYKNTFFTNMKETEKLVIEEKSMKVNELTSNQDIKDKNIEAFGAICDSMKDEDNYIKSLDETNKLIEEINIKEKGIFKFYRDTEEKTLNKIKDNLYFLLITMKTTNAKINYDIDLINKKCLDIKLENEIKNLLEKNNYNYSLEKKIEFTPYIPSSSLDNSIKSSSQNEKMNINYDVIVYLNKFFTGICGDMDMQEEKRRKKLRSLCLRIFDDNHQNYVKEDQNELIKFMENEDYRNYFISALTHQRLNGKFKREEKLFNELIEILKVILELAEKENNFDNARNCMILSQTFYKEKIVDGNVERVYLMEYIKKNKWLSSTKFWKEFIEDEIIKDKIKFEELQKQNGNKGGDITQIYFSKLITYTHNMNMFCITKDDNFEIIDYFIKKYEIPDSMKSIVINNLNEIYSDKNKMKKKENKENLEKKSNEKINEEKNYLSNEIKNDDKENTSKNEENNNDEKKDIENNSINLIKEEEQKEEKKEEKKEEECEIKYDIIDDYIKDNEKDGEKSEIKNESKKEIKIDIDKNEIKNDAKNEIIKEGKIKTKNENNNGIKNEEQNIIKNEDIKNEIKIEQKKEAKNELINENKKENKEKNTNEERKKIEDEWVIEDELYNYFKKL